MQTVSTSNKPILVLGGTGNSGRRIVERLRSRGLSVRVGSRSANPPFDWAREDTWDDALTGVSSIYISYAPDLAIPGAKDAIAALVWRAKLHGVKRLVLLSGRGEAEAQACEKIVQDSGLEWTIVRASWFAQNFSEGAFADMVPSGIIALPGGDTPEPFVDLDDVADVALAALTEEGHGGEVYEVTGPRLMTLHDVARDLAHATGHPVRYVDVPHDEFIGQLADTGAPEAIVWLLDYLFSTVLDGRNASLADGVQRALGRPPRDFAHYAREAARAGAWEIAA